MIRIIHGIDYRPIRYVLYSLNPLLGTEFRFQIVCDVMANEYDMVDVDTFQSEAVSVGSSEDFCYKYRLSHRIYCGIDYDYAVVSDVLTEMWTGIWDTYLTHGHENPIQIKNVVLHEKRVP